MEKIIEQGMLGQDCLGETIRYTVRQGAEPGQVKLKVEGFRTFESKGSLMEIRRILKGHREAMKLFGSIAASD